MKKVVVLILAVAGFVAARRLAAGRAEADLWHEATKDLDLR